MKLQKSQKNIEVYYSTELGSCYFGDSLELIKELADNSVNLIVTSPPFALTSQKE